MKLILKKIYKKSLEKFFQFIYGEIYLQNKQIKISKILSNIKLSKKKYYTYLIEKGRIFTDGIQNVSVIKKNFLLKECSFQHAKNKIVNITNNPVLKKGTPKIKIKFKGTVLNLLQGASSENYFHWLFDLLPKIYICSKNYNLSKINYFYLSEPKNFQIQILNFFGIKKNQIISSKFYRHIEADQIIVVDHPWYKKGYFFKEFNQIPKWIIWWLRNIFLNKKKKFNCGKKIFIDRSDSKFNHSQIINKNEVINFLKKKKFEIYKIAKMNFFKQVYLFYNANFIISAHGAALANLVFCKSNTKIIEIKPETQPGNYFKKISKINKLKYICMINKIEKNSLKGDMIVSLKNLEKLIIKINKK